MAQHVYTYDDPPSERDLRRACQVLANNGVIAYCCGLNWALGCDVLSSKALERMRSLKPHHPQDRPFSLLCASISMASDFANIDQPVYRILRKIWPGPYTVLLQRNRNLPKQIKDKRKIVGLRVPENKMVTALIELYGRPIVTTSVPKLPDQSIAKFGYQIEEHFGHAVDLILDLGAEVPGVESTILDMSESEPLVVRKGAGEVEFIVPRDA